MTIKSTISKDAAYSRLRRAKERGSDINGNTVPSGIKGAHNVIQWAQSVEDAKADPAEVIKTNDRNRKNLARLKKNYIDIAESDVESGLKMMEATKNRYLNSPNDSRSAKLYRNYTQKYHESVNLLAVKRNSLTSFDDFTPDQAKYALKALRSDYNRLWMPINLMEMADLLIKLAKNPPIRVTKRGRAPRGRMEIPFAGNDLERLARPKVPICNEVGKLQSDVLREQGIDNGALDSFASTDASIRNRVKRGEKESEDAFLDRQLRSLFESSNWRSEVVPKIDVTTTVRQSGGGVNACKKPGFEFTETRGDIIEVTCPGTPESGMSEGSRWVSPFDTSGEKPKWLYGRGGLSYYRSDRIFKNRA